MLHYKTYTDSQFDGNLFFDAFALTKAKIQSQVKGSDPIVWIMNTNKFRHEIRPFVCLDNDRIAIAYTALEQAKQKGVDVLIVDTAGRLQNKVNLMNELEKMNRIIKRTFPQAPQETLLVIDATTGQNGVSQAKEFSKITNITGIVLTKMDGTAKGGIVLSIKDSLNIPVKFIGLGESMDDLQEFDLEQYIYGLCKNMME